MRSDRRPNAKQFKVVVNHEEQYKAIPAGDPTPKGWRDTGKSGTEAECLKDVKNRQARAKKE
jgi:MbtH protein